MKTQLRFCLRTFVATAFAVAGLAQQWEMGGAAGGSLLTNASANGASGTATAGFQPGFAASAYAVNHLQPILSGELRYTFLQSNLKLSAGGTQVTFSGMAHAIHYDLLLHPRDRENVWLPFAAVGAGVKVYQGTGQESAYQPLSQYAYLTRTHQAEPLVSVGGGVRYRLRPRLSLRLEVRDYLTPFPQKVIAPAQGKISGWLHDFVPLVGIGYLF